MVLSSSAFLYVGFDWYVLIPYVHIEMEYRLGGFLYTYADSKGKIFYQKDSNLIYTTNMALCLTAWV